MKKAILLLLALAVLGGAAFAQVTFNGYVRAIGTITEDKVADEFDFTYADRVRLNMSWTSEDKNVLFRSRWQYTTAGWAAEPNYMFGQVKLADGMLAISGGDLWNFDYDVASGISEYYNGNVANFGAFTADGMLVQVMPMEGLSLGLGLDPNGNKFGVEHVNVFAKYAMADLGSLILTGNLVEEVEDSLFSATVKFTGVESLGIAAGYKMKPDANSAFGIIDFATGPVTLQVSPEYGLDTEVFYVEASVKFAASEKLDLLAHYNNKDEETFVAAEVLFKAAKGALLQANLVYDSDKGISVPLILKVSF